ncbi:MAG: ADP-ribosylglycohydrolase family protein [Nitrospirae bacterium]|nr:ADP-ribosylglycohydrolase family protein [Nitrospirota bacterium]MBF0541938.1 ADP-ribosylglycohydrolase family protein [Nitrospirota bacterium]
MTITSSLISQKSIIGSILGTAVGDALGLPCEGLSIRRQKKMFPDLTKFHFLPNRGMTSDDTEHTCMVAQAMIDSKGEVLAFSKNLSWRFRFWLTRLPAGIGKATLMAILKLWIGYSSDKSGVFSAGNGPAMRSAIIGVCYGHDNDRLIKMIKASTIITHTDPKAELGSFAIALCAYLASINQLKDISEEEYFNELKLRLPYTKETKEFFDIILKVINSVKEKQDITEFMKTIGLNNGVTGYIYHTLPVVLHVWFRNQTNYKKAILEVISCGGDTDTQAAILGGIIGARVGKEGIPIQWLNSIWEWPCSVKWMEGLGNKLYKVLSNEKDFIDSNDNLIIFIPALLIRNLFFMIIVLLHGYRRLLPPY